MNKLKIGVVHPWDRAKWSEPLMWDGLHGAIKLIGQKHDVKWFLQGEEPDASYDWILPWGVGSIPFNFTIQKYKTRKALLCAGHPQDTANMEKFDHVFVESPDVLEQLKPYCKRISIAFGTDTEFFQPKQEEKMFDVFYPATFSDNWKRQGLFAEAVKGYRAMACGLLQPDGMEGYQKCLENGVYCMEGLIPTAIIAKLYNMSKVVVITSWHGSERSALEALATNIPLVITADNQLAVSLVKDHAIIVDPNPVAIREGIEKALTTTVNTRDFILANYSHEIYAKNILEVLEK